MTASAQVLLYNPLRGTVWFSRACALFMLASFFFGITAVALMWRTSPAEYPYNTLVSSMSCTNLLDPSTP